MRPDSHEIFGRRRGRNVGVGLLLGAFVALTFAVTVVKLGQGQASGHNPPAERSAMPPKGGN